jgi:membrane protein DedA with SNARE-associated domain
LTWHATIIVLFAVLVGGGVGLPIPEDLSLIAAGALAQPGLVRLSDVALAGFADVVIADWILYGLGRYYGPAIVGHPSLGRVHGAGRIQHWLVLGWLIALALYLAVRAWAPRAVR